MRVLMSEQTLAKADYLKEIRDCVIEHELAGAIIEDEEWTIEELTQLVESYETIGAYNEAL